MSHSTLCVFFSCKEFKGDTPVLVQCGSDRRKDFTQTVACLNRFQRQDTADVLAPKFRDPELKNKKDWQLSPPPSWLCWEPGCGEAPSFRGKSLHFVPTVGEWPRFNHLTFLQSLCLLVSLTNWRTAFVTHGLDNTKSSFLDRKWTDCSNVSGCLEQKDHHGFSIRDGVPPFSSVLQGEKGQGW